MQADRTVKLYVNNRADDVIEVDPFELAAEFSDALDNGVFTDPPKRASIEFAYKWWIGMADDGKHASWDEVDWDTLVDGLVAYWEDKPELKKRLWKAVCP